MKPNTVAALLSFGRKQLAALAIPTAAIDARLLLQAAAHLTHEEIVAAPDTIIEPARVSVFEAFITRRLKHEPVSRILGRREFYGRQFKVSSDVLDPRPETEALIELALQHASQGRFLDLGTGSGIIAITLCAENQNLSGTAVDISAAALRIAKENAETLGVSDHLIFHNGSWFEGLTEKFDLIISNPPYVSSEAELPRDVFDYDPHVALFADGDELDSYRAISAKAAAFLKPGGAVMVEIGMGQGPQVAELFAKQGFELFGQAEDLGGRLRALAFKQR